MAIKPRFSSYAVDPGAYIPHLPRGKTMKVSGWSKGSADNRTGAGYGVRISYTDRDRYFRRNRGPAEVVLDSGEVVDVPLSEKFWTTCPELRSSMIGRWMLKRGVAPWAKNEPSQFDLELIGTGDLTWCRIGSELSQNVQCL